MMNHRATSKPGKHLSRITLSLFLLLLACALFVGASAETLPSDEAIPASSESVLNGAADSENADADASEEAVPGDGNSVLNAAGTPDTVSEADAPAAEIADEVSPDSVPANEIPDADANEVPAGDTVPELNTSGETPAAQEPAVSYDYNAELFNSDTGSYPGVYATPIDPNSASAENAPTIGMPSIADANLDTPTTESPAIIQGAAVGYEEKTGPAEYTVIDERPEPYTDFKYNIVEEAAQDGSVHRKVTGFDGTYVITRLDVSSFFTAGGTAAGQYLHMKQEQNMALIPGMGMTDNNHGFADQTGNKTGAYLLSDLLDANGSIPYIDVILFSTGKNAAGADTGKQGMANGDVPLQLYVDNTFDYNPDLVYDPASTDPNHQTQVLAKFFDASKVNADAVSRFNIKGSDLALEIAVENSGGEQKDTGITYWSLEKGFEDPYYDLPEDKDPQDEGCGRTMKLICEVPVTEEISFQGADENDVRKRTLDVNSFDIQIANNTTPDAQTYTSGLTLQDSWLTIEDMSNTTGAEMAVGNNSRFVIEHGGRLVIDETCQMEIEWDGATTTPAADGTAPAAPDTLNNGLLDLRAGGTIVNNGIITIEGTEGKPIQPDAPGQADADKGCGEMTVEKDAILINNGCLMINGKFYNLGALTNTGSYDDLIVSNDPDKGIFAYHKGIQVSWKDDVTQPNVVPGALYNGKDKDGNVQQGARIYNKGDIVLVPGTLENQSFLNNSPTGRVLLAAATEAIIPFEPDPNNPTVQYKRVTIDPPNPSSFVNSGRLLNYGLIDPASVGLNDNQSLGVLTSPGNNPDLFSLSGTGTVINRNHIYGQPDYERVPDEEPVPEDDPVPAVDIDVRPGGETGDTWLYLYGGKTFVLRCPDGIKLNGTLRTEDGVLVFILDDGTEIKPETDAEGSAVYTFLSGSVTIQLTPEFIAEMQADPSGSWLCLFHQDGTLTWQALAK